MSSKMITTITLLGFWLMPAPQERVTPPTPPAAQDKKPITFRVQDQRHWTCTFEGGDLEAGVLPTALRCIHSVSGEVVLYLPTRPKAGMEKKGEKK